MRSNLAQFTCSECVDLRNAFEGCFESEVERFDAKFLMSKLLRGSKKVPTQIDLSIIEVKSKVSREFCHNPFN